MRNWLREIEKEIDQARAIYKGCNVIVLVSEPLHDLLIKNITEDNLFIVEDDTIDPGMQTVGIPIFVDPKGEVSTFNVYVQVTFKD
jgi:hypothetical protein